MKLYHLDYYLRPEGTVPLWIECEKKRVKPEPPHSHNCMEIMHIRSGAACCRINERHYPAVRGDLYVFAPGDVHAFTISGHLTYDTLLFSASLFSEEEIKKLQENRIFASWCTPGDFKEKKLSIPPGDAGTLDNMCDELAAECRKTSPCNAMLRKALFIRLLFAALSKGGQGHPETSNDLQLSRLFDFILNHYQEELTLSRLARAAGVSPGYLNEFMHRNIGQGAMEYLIRFRVEQSRALLENTAQSIAEIGVACGFYDASHFIRTFSRITGMSPGRYRKLAGSADI